MLGSTVRPVPHRPRRLDGAQFRASLTTFEVLPSSHSGRVYREARSTGDNSAPRCLAPMMVSSYRSPMRTLREVHASRNVPTPRMPSTPPVPLLATPSEQPVQTPTVLAATAHMPVHPFVTRHLLTLHVSTTRNRFRTPALPKLAFNHLPPVRRHLAGNA